MHMEHVITVVDVFCLEPPCARGVGGGRDSARHSRRVLAAETKLSTTRILSFCNR